MSDDVTIEDGGTVARVCEKSADGRTIHLENRNGTVAKASTSSGDPFPFSIGEIVLYWAWKIESAPASLWPTGQAAASPTVAVVRLKAEDVTVIDEGARWRLVTTTQEPPYEVGNTVLLNPSGAIIRVLAAGPLQLIDLKPSSVDVSRFKEDVSTLDASFDDFGGMPAIVKRAKELIELPLRRRDELRAIGARPIKGVLFAGPPGSGKTLLARIIAASAHARFYRVSGPEIVSKWFGETEAVLRAIFEDAADHPSIVFFDEIDSVAANRDHDTHGASQRVVAQLLTLMDGFKREANVVVIAATNRVEALDPALRRPGRFDWEIEFPMPNAVDRQRILISSGKRISQDEGLPFLAVASKTDGWTAADLSAIWSESALLAASDDRSRVDEEDFMAGFARVERQRRQKGGAG